jgi:hypothetical protein
MLFIVGHFIKLILYSYDRMSKKTTYATVPLKDHQGLLVKVSYDTYIYCHCTLLKYRTKETKQYTGIFLAGRDFFQEKQSYLSTESPLFKYEGGDNPFDPSILKIT